ncbi:MAG TPA: universal stress protein [Chitinophagaceae bacterium]|nr:universal stress protein [Chitinophagaceae bacterium]
MNTVIVPVDFSETSRNSAFYATKLLTGHYGVEMILYHVYDKASQAAEAESQIEKLKAELMEAGIVKISTMVEEGKDLIHELETLARHRRADLIIMGITGRHALGKVFLGSNTLKIVEQKVCPVLIIPPNAQFKEIKNVMLASDFKEAVKSTPSVPVKKVLKTFQPSLHIVNVDNKHYVSLTEEYQDSRAGLKEMFKEFNPEFYFLGMNDVDEAINQFAHDKNIDFITIIHREHSLLDRMFRTSHTKKLAYQSNIPVLAVHE